MNTIIQPLPNRGTFYESSNSYYSPLRGLFILEDIFQNSICEDSEMCETPPEIKVPLRLHQKSMLYAMENAETVGAKGRPVYNETLYSNIGILGDRVGVGKSLMVLSHIARMKTNTKEVHYNNTSVNNSPSIFSIKKYVINDLSANTLIVVPHNLYRQWQDYIESQTTLKACFIKGKTLFIDPESTETEGQTIQTKSLAKNILKSDFSIVSNTLYPALMQYCKTNNLEWKRVFFDEADSIHITSTTHRIKAGFIWFITASWANMVFHRDSRFSQQSVDYCKKYKFHPEVEKWLKKESIGNSNYYYGSFNIRSNNYFKDYMSLHPLRGNIVLTSSPQYLETSINMPLIKEQIIECLPSVASMILGNLINDSIKSLLHAGDIKGALNALGVNETDNISLIQAVNLTRTKELDNYKKTLAFKETLDYATPASKEAALKNLREKISSLESQIKTLHDRISNVKSEVCGICYDEPDPVTITPCCSQIFCGRCILLSMEKNAECPMCRAVMNAKKLIMLGQTTPTSAMDLEDPNRPLKKPDQLLKLIRENPTGQFLVFSRYDNPFDQIRIACESENISIRQVKGNRDVVNSILHSFEDGHTRVLFLNSAYSGAGLNIISASHVVLLHAMSTEEEKQIVGRAYRLGRTKDLNVIKLLHPGER